PAALEHASERLIAYIDDAKDDRYEVRHIVKLDPDEGMTAWFMDGHSAKYGVEAIKAFVDLDAETTDAKRGAELWVAGLAGNNPILVEALLDRCGAATEKAETTPDGYGEECAARARRDFAADPAAIQAAALAHVTSTVPPTRERTLTCAWIALR